MLKKNRRKIILSSIVILLPVLFGLILWDELPDPMAVRLAMHLLKMNPIENSSRQSFWHGGAILLSYVKE